MLPSLPFGSDSVPGDSIRGSRRSSFHQSAPMAVASEEAHANSCTLSTSAPVTTAAISTRNNSLSEDQLSKYCENGNSPPTSAVELPDNNGGLYRAASAHLESLPELDLENTGANRHVLHAEDEDCDAADDSMYERTAQNVTAGVDQEELDQQGNVDAVDSFEDQDCDDSDDRNMTETA